MTNRTHDVEVILREAVTVAGHGARMMGTQMDLRKVTRWLRTLNDSTVHAYRKIVAMEPDSMNGHHSEQMSPPRFVVAAAESNLDDTEAALMAFVVLRVGVSKHHSLARLGNHYVETEARVNSLHDQFLYGSRAFLSDGLVEAVLDGNILEAAPEVQMQAEALVRATMALAVVDIDRSLLVYGGTSSHGTSSIAIPDGRLVKLILDHASDAELLAERIIERRTGDAKTLRLFMESAAPALSVGLL